MSGQRAHFLAIVLAVGCLTTGCGAMVPDIKEIWDKDIPSDPATNRPPVPGAGQIEFEIKKRLFCDLKDAVQKVNNYYVETSKTGAKRRLIPLDWGALVSLSLEVDESSALNPAVALNTVLPNAVTNFPGLPSVTTPQSFSLGFGGAISSTATRIDKFNPYYSIAHLMKPYTRQSVCHPENDPFTRLSLTPASSSPFIIESDLGIKDWLMGAAFANALLPSDQPTPLPAADRSQRGGGAGQTGGATGRQEIDTLTYEIKFVIVSNGNVTPTWKLVKVSANAGAGTFFSVGRTRTHDLIITIGPPTSKTDQRFSSAETGAAVGNAIRTLIPSMTGQ
jgi:hypothetical protein